MIQQIKNILIDNPQGAWSILNGKGLLSEVEKLTLFIDNHYNNKITWSQRFWHIKNDKLELELCGCCNVNLARYRKFYYITCSEKCRNIGSREKCKETCIDKFGVDNAAKTDDYKEKSQKTCEEKYGVKHLSQLEENREKQRKKFKSKNFQDLKDVSVKKRYGVNNIAQLESTKQKYKKTCQKKYGVDHTSKTIQFQESYQKDLPKGYKLVGYKRGVLILNHKLCKSTFDIERQLFDSRILNNINICLECNPKYKAFSDAEKKLLEFVKSIYHGKIIENTKKVINPFELDIYIPNLKLGIEYNGDYTHANPKFYKVWDKVWDRTAKDIWQRDSRKKQLCIKQGIKLIIVWEHDWINNQEEIKNMLRKELS